MPTLAKKLPSYFTLQTVALNLIVAAVYIISAKYGFGFASLHPSATAIWPPTGIALASLLLFGYRLIPAIIFGAFYANITTAGTITTTAIITVGNTLEALVGAYLVKRYANGVQAFENISHLIRYVFFAAVVSTMISATIGVSALLFSHSAKLMDATMLWITWWFGNMGGNLVIAPLIILWRKGLDQPINLKKIFSFLAALSLVFVTTTLVFSGFMPYIYLCFPVAIGIALWFEQKGAVVTTFFVAIIATMYTVQGLGPFISPTDPDLPLVLLQLFLSIFAMTALFFASSILEIKKSKQETTLFEKRFQSLIENSVDALVLIDANSRISYASPSVLRVLGYTPKEMQGMIGFNLIYKEDLNLTVKTLARLVLQPNRVDTIEYRTVRKDGQIIWVEATGMNLLLDSQVNAVVINFHDITEKKKIERKMLKEKREDEAMLASIGEGIIATDNRGVITMVNEAACSLLSTTAEQLVGKSLVDTIPMESENGEVIPVSNRPMTKVLSHGKMIVRSTNTYYVKEDKTKIPIRFTLTPIVLDNETVGTIEVFHDLTKEKELDKTKKELITIASHQLRTPLSTINWYVEQLMEKKDKTEREANYFQEIYRASRRMVDLTNALLNISSLELGTFAVEVKNTEVTPIIEQILKDLEHIIVGKNITVEKKYEQTIPTIDADPKLLATMIQNLVSNAIKYTKDNGKIMIRVFNTYQDFNITVSDTGIGIPTHQKEKLFTKMFRADNAKQFVPEGSGLGLYIVKTILDATGGTITYTSEEDIGTAFTISFPISGMRRKPPTV